jgi:hypothetical protein
MSSECGRSRAASFWDVVGRRDPLEPTKARVSVLLLNTMTWMCAYCRASWNDPEILCLSCGKERLCVPEYRQHYANTVVVEEPHGGDPDTNDVYTIIRHLRSDNDVVNDVRNAGIASGEGTGTVKKKFSLDATAAPSKCEKIKYPMQIGKMSPVQSAITEFFKQNKAVSSPGEADERIAVKSGKDGKPLAILHDNEEALVAYVKNTPLCERRLATVFTPVWLREWDSGTLPAGVRLVNDFDGNDPNRLLLTVEDDVEELPDMILDATWQGANDYLSGECCETVTHWEPDTTDADY